MLIRGRFERPNIKKNASKTFLYAFLLRLYESGKYFFMGRRDQTLNPTLGYALNNANGFNTNELNPHWEKETK